MSVKQFLRNHYIFLAAFCLITRIPFASGTLYSWDSVQFALALHHFDAGIHQPHPPGYFLYVALGRIFRAFILDDNKALVALSITFSILSVLVAYAFACMFVKRGTALLTAVYYLLSPLVWFKGEIALSYMGEGFFSVCIGFFCYRFLRKRNYRDLIFSTFFLGLSGGIRQNTIVFLAPLWLYSMFNGLASTQNTMTYRIKHIIIQTLFLCALAASWFLPMVLLSGGFHAYSDVLNSHWSRVAMRTSFFRHGPQALAVNGAIIWMFLFYAFTSGLFLLACYFYSLLRNKKIANETAHFFAAWCIPSILFYLLVHINYPGYVFTFLPALFLAFAKAVEWLQKNAPRLVCNVVLVFIFITNPAVFLLVPIETSAPAIMLHDMHLNALVKTIRGRFPPGKTVILSFNHLYYGFRHAMVYLPEYTSYEVYPEAGYDGNTRRFLGGDEHRYKQFEGINIPRGIKYVVLFSDHQLGYPFVEKTLKKNEPVYALLQNNFVLNHTPLPPNFGLYWFELRK